MSEDVQRKRQIRREAKKRRHKKPRRTKMLPARPVDTRARALDKDCDIAAERLFDRIRAAIHAEPVPPPVISYVLGMVQHSLHNEEWARHLKGSKK